MQNITNFIQLIGNVNAQLLPNEQIDGVGVQGHFGCYNAEIPHPDHIIARLDQLYTSTGNTPIYVTELDLGLGACPGTTFIVADPLAPFNDSIGNLGNNGNP